MNTNRINNKLGIRNACRYKEPMYTEKLEMRRRQKQKNQTSSEGEDSTVNASFD